MESIANRKPLSLPTNSLQVNKNNLRKLIFFEKESMNLENCADSRPNNVELSESAADETNLSQRLSK